MSGAHVILDKESGLQKRAGLNWRFGPDGKLDRDMAQPVVFVSWNDARDLAKWMSENFNGTYRLPTEAEWEYAARGGIRSQAAKVDSMEVQVLSKYERLRRIGDPNAIPNEIGAFHMNGSLSEWCLDWYDKNYYRQSAKDSPMGPGSGEMKVIRGNSWVSAEQNENMNSRKKTSPNLCSFLDGFRVVRIDH